MNIGFVGHSYHQVTRSSRFFTALLETLGTVEYVWDESWRKKGPVRIPQTLLDADLIVVWQSIAYAKRLARSRHPNIAFIPMFDSCRELRQGFWGMLRSFKVVSFSSALHERVQRCGHSNSAYFQYFPDPSEYPRVSDYDFLRAFFWQRQARPDWNDIKQLIGQQRFSSLTLHTAADPGQSPTILPAPAEIRERGIELTEWFPDRNAFLRKLGEANVFFAPRLYEGIGLSFLEAMAMGMAVCAHDSPTHNEYIVDGVSGFLFGLDHRKPPPWDRVRDIGPRARISVEKGFARWRSDQERLLDFLREPRPSRRLRAYARTASLPVDPKADYRGETRSAVPAHDRQAPKVTIAIVVRNAARDLETTLQSVMHQSFREKEVIVIDGASDDGTLDVILAYSDRIDQWRSERDQGPYDAMNKAADLARGRWIIYINAGDCFVDEQALERFVAGVPEDIDFIAGHHVYVAPAGVEEIHRCADFEKTWRRLLAGEVGGNWLGGVPGHQSLLTRTELIRRHRYDLAFRFAADHEFLYRMRAKGATLHVEPVIVSRYVGGGLSWQNLFACLEEWRSIALKYTRDPEAVDRHFRRLHRNTLRYLRRIRPFHWLREPVRSHFGTAVLAELEFRLRALLNIADALYARLTVR